MGVGGVRSVVLLGFVGDLDIKILVHVRLVKVNCKLLL